MISTITRRAPLAALFAMVMTGAPAAAQNTQEADRLTREAVSLYSSPPQFGQAAILHARAAGMRSADDPRRVQDLAAAARLFVYTGQPEAARSTFEQAAQTAIVAGDLVAAGNLYIDAAVVSLKLDDETEARRLLRAARWIAGAPMLTNADQRLLLRRFAGE